MATKAKSPAKAKRSTGRKAATRELIHTGTSKRYVRRNPKGEFHEVDEQHKSLSQDRRKKAKTNVKAGQGDRGDRKRS